ncbi:MAG: hypothetical protein ACFFAH_06580 [Promethearchaeota archaeon]
MVLLDRADRAEFAAQLPPFMIVIFIIIAIALFILFIFVLQYVYKDAVKRDLNGELWLIILILTPIVGFIVYLIVRRGHPKR